MSVYFAQSGAYIKIGYSENPIARMASVTHNGQRPADLPRGAGVDLLGWVPGDRSRERKFHDEYAAWRAGGEWFDIDAETVTRLIWADPRGVDVFRMSALAVYVMAGNSELTRDDVTKLGVQVEGAHLAAALDRMSDDFDAALRSARRSA